MRHNGWNNILQFKFQLDFALEVWFSIYRVHEKARATVQLFIFRAP